MEQHLSEGRKHRNVLRREGSYVFLTDLDTAGYLLQQGVPIAHAVKVDRVHFEFEFYDPEERAEELVIRFLNSPEHGFADAVCRLKKALHRFSGKRKGRNGNGNGKEKRYSFNYDAAEDDS